MIALRGPRKVLMVRYWRRVLPPPPQWPTLSLLVRSWPRIQLRVTPRETRCTAWTSRAVHRNDAIGSAHTWAPLIKRDRILTRLSSASQPVPRYARISAWTRSTSMATAAPAVTLTPTSLAFASTLVGSTTAAKVVTIKNSGTATLNLTSETITGTNATSFIKSATTCGTTLAAAASCTVLVEFKPATTGALKASLSIADNATGSPQAVALTGTGIAPAVTLTPTSLAFASTLVGSTTAAKVVTIKNSGTATLNLTSETITGTNATSFIKSATTCGTTLAAAASCTVSVEFKPAAKGALKASLSIADNATGSPQAVALAGTGN
jgi:Abnormal spindle-like microcephaly-assoc'd, ASPM-SPD-2-Hydin